MTVGPATRTSSFAPAGTSLTATPGSGTPMQRTAPRGSGPKLPPERFRCSPTRPSEAPLARRRRRPPPAGAATGPRGGLPLRIGAPDDSVGGNDLAGAVNAIYGSRSEGLREENDQLFTQDTPGVPETAEAGDRFGASLAVGDIDDDGFADLAIGAPNEGVPTGLGPDEQDRGEAGLAIVLYGSGGGLSTSRAQAWTQDRPGVRGPTEEGDRFAEALAMGDFYGDERDDLAVGVPGDSVGGGRDAGAVNVLYGRRSGLSAGGDQLRTQDTRGIKGVAEANDRFGQALVAADVSENGRAELIVGVPGEGVGGSSDAGAVNVMYGRSGGLSSVDELWSQDTRGIKGVAEATDQFGATLSVADFDRDGDGDLAIGTPGEDVGGQNAAGAVNVLYGNPGDGLTARADQLWFQGGGGLKGQAESGRPLRRCPGLWGLRRHRPVRPGHRRTG